MVAWTIACFWAAYEDPCLECGDWEKYHESKDKYNNLREIKTCVDPNNVFNMGNTLLPPRTLGVLVHAYRSANGKRPHKPGCVCVRVSKCGLCVILSRILKLV